MDQATRLKSAAIEAKRRAKAKRKRTPFDLRAIRLKDLETLLHARYGGKVPNTEDGKTFVYVVASHLALLPRNPFDTIRIWLNRAAPWHTLEQIDAITAGIIRDHRLFKAETLAFRLKVSIEERERLGLITIGAVGQTAAQRRKDRATIKQLRIRRAKGMIPRAEYEAKSLNKQRPWEAEGISRRTWYRRQTK